MKNNARWVFLSLLYVGNIKKAPGTFGTLVSLPFALPILFFSQESLFLCALLVGLIATKQIDIFEQNGGAHDDKSIVIDELVGMWIALSFLNPYELLDKSLFWLCGGVFISFLLFRIFDIFKPSFIGKIDRKVKGGFGVVGDDALAGLVAGICAKLFVFGVLLLESHFAS